MKFIIEIILWISFGVIHSFFISQSFTLWLKRVGKGYAIYQRIAYNLLSGVLFAICLLYTKSIGGSLIIYFKSPWTILQGFLIFTGAVLFLWSFKSYDIWYFLGLRQLWERKKVKEEVKKQKQMAQQGLLRVVRHPIYLATIILLWSLNATLADIIARVILTIYIFIGMRLEERKLILEFGHEYLEYQKRIPALIPFLKR